jgi:two-component system, OmpR family, response regulator BaeR
MSASEYAPTHTQTSAYILRADRCAVLVSGREIALTRMQFRLLAALVSEPDRIFKRSDLVAQVFEGAVSERTIDVHIKDLRRRLEPDGERIETVRGKGYCYRGGRI